MKFCQDHWDKLRAAIEAEGVYELVAKDGKRAAQMFADAVEYDRESLANYDPLMWAHWAIIERIAQHEPNVLFVDGCPLCWVADGHEATCVEPGCEITRQTFEDWIPGVAGAAAERARALREKEAQAIDPERRSTP